MIRSYLREGITIFLLWLVKRINRHKNRVLSTRLYHMSEDYNPRPQGGWE